MATKYPYIPKEYYAAVMFACKMIRENGYFNKAIRTAANYYGVDEDTLEMHVRKRQGAGQKGTTRKYKYYVVAGFDDFQANDDCGTCDSWDYTLNEFKEKSHKHIVKSTSKENAEKQARSWGDRKDFYGFFFRIQFIEEYETENEAKQRVKRLKFDEFVQKSKCDRLKWLYDDYNGGE